MTAPPQPVASRMYFLFSVPPYTTGACKPAAEATSTKCALKGRPDGVGRANGLTVCAATPWPTSRGVAAQAAEPRESRTKSRRVKFKAGLPPPWIQSGLVARTVHVRQQHVKRVRSEEIERTDDHISSQILAVVTYPDTLHTRPACSFDACGSVFYNYAPIGRYADPRSRGQINLRIRFTSDHVFSGHDAPKKAGNR